MRGRNTHRERCGSARMKLLAVFVISLAACRAAPHASLPAGMTELAFYVGDWRCEGVAYDAGVRAAPVPLEIHVRPVLGGSWLEVAVFDRTGQRTTELKGYDPATKQLHHIWATPDGAWGSLTSHGWAGANLVFDVDQPDPKAKERMTFTRVDDTHFTHRAEVDEGRGYQLAYEKTCHKG